MSLEHYDQEKDLRGSRGLALASKFFLSGPKQSVPRGTLDYEVFGRLATERNIRPGARNDLRQVRSLLVDSGYTHMYLGKGRNAREVSTLAAEPAVVRAAFNRVYSGYLQRCAKSQGFD